MTSPTTSRTGSATSKQLAAVATAAIPVIMLSSLAMAQPAAATAPTGPKVLPAAVTHGGLASALTRVPAVAGISTSVVAGTLPAGIVPQAPASPATHTVVDGDTVSGICAALGLSTVDVLALNNLSAETVIHPGQVLTLSPGAAAPTAAPAQTPHEGASDYIVVGGDTISSIAAHHGLSTADLLATNGMNATSNTIYPGQKIKLSAQASPSTPAQISVAPTPVASQATPASTGSYVISAGDTLSSIAAHHGVSAGALAAANGIADNGTIYAGKSLSIPGVTSAASSVEPIGTSALTADQAVPSTFLHYTYPQAVVADANKNKAALLAAPAPSTAQMKEIVVRTAASMGVDPALALAFAQQESGFRHQVVSPANAIGTMQVIPDAGEWASGLVGHSLNLLDPQDNVTAGVAIIRALLRDAPTEDEGIAGYYQGQYSVSVYGMYPDTVNYVAGVKAKRDLFR